MDKIIRARALVTGDLAGDLLASNEPLSFWGGYDQNSGEIIDRRHPLSGQIAAGKVLAIPFTRGSSTTTAVLLEAVKVGKAPAALLTIVVDRFLVLASIVADEMYARPIPILALDPADFANLLGCHSIKIQKNGELHLKPDERGPFSS